MIKKLAEKLEDIFAEPILSRRQHLFSKLLKSEYSTLFPLISLSFAIKNKVTIRIISNASELKSDVRTFFGTLFSYYDSGKINKLKSTVRLYPKEYQVLAKWVFESRFITKLTYQWLLQNIDAPMPLYELKESFLILPTQSTISIVDSKEVEGDLKLLIPSPASSGGRLMYFFKVGSIIETNITSSVVKNFLLGVLQDKINYGVILFHRTEKGRKIIHHLTFVVGGDNVECLKNLYAGKECEQFLNCKFRYFERIFRSSGRVRTHFTKEKTIHSVEELSKEPVKSLKNAYLLHSRGFTKIKLTRSFKFAKVVDYLLNDDYEPIGLKINEDGELLDIHTKITKNFIDRGINNSYVKIEKIYFDNILLDTSLVSILKKNYKECGMCGAISQVKRHHLCWVCLGLLFRTAVEHGCDKEFVLHKTPHNKTLEFPLYKFDVVFSENGINFTENLENWKNKELYLPYDWWEK